ncbi:hypothetical protein KO494_12240 [Lacinutrix sp. C3R15]|uniref:hypothetical protein n=1 Tax=Flavobacteriaceae TaxID=49546 RepID=UPI001C088626|nr:MULTISPECIES: hypothetical protein [Flavobacteriaceae]MBU2940307.1 hypothetical protein [Lacinutrix sp. C3R15]MDO6623627.1 hypothetical protein [Oceanihabitans sp. 1_MG-2023]
MKTVLLYKITIAFLLIPMLLVANNNPVTKGKHTKEKIIKKEFSVNADTTLKVANSYGNIDIVTWEENRISFEITITTNGNDLEKVEEKLDEISVNFENSPSLVSAKTIFNKSKSNSWFKWNSGNNVNMKINYVIKMPITNQVNLTNDYGNINLDKLKGRAIINCDYGKITTKELLADNNDIHFDYSNNCYFEYLKSGKITADYSGFTVAKAKKINIEADYTKSVVEIAEEVTYNCDYGSIHIEKANHINGDGDYLTTRIGNIYKNLNINADYGSIKIDNITANAENINIASDYVGITIGYDPAYNFSFNIDLEYASLRDYEGLEFTKKRIESTDKYYQGYHGKDNSGNTLKISSDYGSVTLKQN